MSSKLELFSEKTHDYASRDSNSGALAWEARILPLNH